VQYSKFLHRYKLRVSPAFKAKWSKRMIALIAKYLQKNIEDLEGIFSKMDSNRDGWVSYGEFSAAMRDLQLGLTDEHVFELGKAISGCEADEGGFTYQAFFDAFSGHFERLNSGDGANVLKALDSVPTSPSFKPWEFMERVRNQIMADREFLEGFIDEKGPIKSWERLHELLTFYTMDYDYHYEDVKYAVYYILKENPLSRIDVADVERIFDLDESSADDDWKSAVIENLASTIFQARSSLSRVFMLFDVDRDGRISKEEFTDGLEMLTVHTKVPLTREQCGTLFDSMDAMGEGLVCYDEFFNTFSIVDTHGIDS